MEFQMVTNIDDLLLRPASITETRLGRVEYVCFGKGETVLALHGGMGGHDQSLILARAAFADLSGYRVIAMSRPGYLGTPRDSGETPEAQADLYAALLDSLGIGQAVVVAVSAGGPSAIQFALNHPERCKALILVSCCTGHLAIPEEMKKRLPLMTWFARFGWLAGLMRWRVRRDPAKAASRAVADPELRDRTLAHPVAGPLLKALQQSPFAELGRRLPGTLNDMHHFERLSALPFERVSVPLLAIHGTGDRIVPVVHGERALSAAAGELMRIDGGEHVAIFTHLDAIRDRVARFLGGLN
jgi:pimeloyl-ACP methyl ester carboxylesterase